MNTGKRNRIRRLINPKSGRSFIVAMDHGFSDGPIKGLKSIPDRLKFIGADALDAVVVHQGMAPRLEPILQQYQDLALIVHLSGSTYLAPDPNAKQLVSSVEQALRLGADAVSVHVNLGATSEAQMLADLGQVSQSCQAWGMPLLAMTYPRGPSVDDPYSPKTIGLAIRVAMEMGCDLVKTYYTGELDTFASLLEGVDIPVLIAGGPKVDSAFQLFKMIRDALRAGATGVCLGRNVFQHPHADVIAEAIENIIHKNFSVQDATTLLEEAMEAEA